ncbi:MAG: M48 family metalloprotease [Clostridia bacterium]|nr:M48 family metalloprotease [Clostridia bacterium]
MYIISFCKSLFKPKNALPAIYFFANAVIVFFLFYILPFQLTQDEQMNRIYLGLIGLAVNLVFILISLTPMGEAFWRLRNKIKRQPKDETLMQDWMSANEAFEEVKSAARSFTKSVSIKVKLYFSNTEDINAYALGHRTVIITKGMLGADPEYIKGVLAHELGHIAHGDSDLKLGINVSNSILTVFLTLLSCFTSLIVIILASIDKDITRLTAAIINFLFRLVIIGLFNLWNLVGVLFINWSSRKAEYAADKFANDLGYGEQLANFLNILDGNSGKSSRFDLMFQTHPDTQDRLTALGYAVA